MKVYLILTGCAWLFVAIIHLSRIVFHWSAVINGVHISTSVDVGTIIISIVLALGAFYFAKKA